MNQLVTTSDGSHTIFVPEINEHYHSIHGAVQESEYIFLKNGFNFCKADPINIFEAGFGTGLNALLTAVRCIKEKREVFYTSIEKYPLADDIIRVLNYHLFAGKEGQYIFDRIHESEWNGMQNICGNFNLRKIKGDLTSDHLTGCYDLIYFDAFGPDKQPEMWSRNVFTKISGITAKNGILITYSVKGDVKRNLKSCGFDVHILPGPPGKRQILRAIKK
ncbi:MAG: tRNA (5-methylaminomethyl-2-thiouridine)(34)-methyltransferase MnmD [Bacteroidales bacterium]|nr:tRNA (5-methylaminomethyl-2-thiouridine)(34)-methyltransferase MnmD [Bacteroidales bacterium]